MNPKETYHGRDPALVVLFLEGNNIQWYDEYRKSWHDMPEYTGDYRDIYRVSAINYHFRLKPKTTTANIHVHVCPRKNTVWATADQSPCADNIKVTFDENGTPIKAEIL